MDLNIIRRLFLKMPMVVLAKRRGESESRFFATSLRCDHQLKLRNSRVRMNALFGRLKFPVWVLFTVHYENGNV